MFRKTLLFFIAAITATGCLKTISKYEQQEFTDDANAQGIEIYMRTHKVVHTEYGPEIMSAEDGDPDNLWETRHTAPVTKATPYESLIGHAFLDTTKIKIIDPDGDTLEQTTGIWIYIHNKGHKDQRPNDSSAVLVKYTGYLLNDHNFTIQPTGATLYLGSETITGFSAGMRYFQPGYLGTSSYTDENGKVVEYKDWKDGGTGLILMPSKFAYGDEISGSIPPNSALVFNINLCSIANFLEEGEEVTPSMSLVKNTEQTKWINLAPYSSYIVKE